LQLAIELAEQILKIRLEISPEVIIPIVQEAVSQLTSVQKPAQIFLHPNDAEIIQEHIGETLGEDGWRIVSDLQITPGGCRIDTHSNSVDARFETRWNGLREILQQSIDTHQAET